MNSILPPYCRFRDEPAVSIYLHASDRQIIYRLHSDNRFPLDDLDHSRQTDHIFPFVYDLAHVAVRPVLVDKWWPQAAKQEGDNTISTTVAKVF